MDYQKNLTESEVRYGEIKIPKFMAEIFPKYDPAERRNMLTIVIGADEHQVLYDNDNTRLRSMRSIFLKHGIKAGDAVHFEVIKKGISYRLEFPRKSD